MIVDIRPRLAAVKRRLTTYLFRSRWRLLDMDWYHTHNQLGRLGTRLPLLHALWNSSRAGYISHPLFDEAFFVAQCRERQLPVPSHPLRSYLRDKRYWQVDPHPLFDTAFYLQQQASQPDGAPLLHYLNHGHLQYDPHPLFCRRWYVISYPLLKTLRHHCALVHYVKKGWRDLVSTHPLFDAATYAAAARLPLDSGKPLQDPLQHFLQSPSTTASCHPLFVPEYFAAQAGIPDRLPVTTLLLTHYMQQPLHWRASTHLLFDAPYYLAQCSADAATKPPLQHYIEDAKTACNPHPLFHNDWYLGRKKNLLQFKGQGRVPLLHFVTRGYRMGESPHPLFALQWYRHTYLQGKVDDTNPLIEFLTVGEQQGNRPNPLFPQEWQRILRDHYHCECLRDFAIRSPCVLPENRNRIADVFLTQYLLPTEPAQGTRPESRNYFILFTPRSGSSWLTELIAAGKSMGRPSEWFNPDLMLSALNGLPQQCHNIDDYCAALQLYRQSSQGMFGVELSASQLVLLQELVDVADTFRRPAYVVHLRRNLIAQAVSLTLATESGFFHATNTINRAAVVPFNAVKINKWLDELVREEKFFHSFLQQQKSSYLLSWYEDICDDSQLVLQRIANHLGMPLPDSFSLPASSQHSKIGGAVNQEYEQRFREEYPAVVAVAENARPFACVMHS